MKSEEVKMRLEDAFSDCQTQVEGGGANFQVIVVSNDFEGLNTVKRQQKVYACFADELKSGEIHALTMKTFTQQQWQESSEH